MWKEVYLDVKVEAEEMVFAVQVECSVEVHTSARRPVLYPVIPGAVSIISVLISPAKMNAYQFKRHTKVNIFSINLL